MSKKHPYYDCYRELAFLYVTFFMSGKDSSILMSKSKIKEKMLELFPEEENFEELLEISEFHGSIRQDDSDLNITDLGIETATRLNDSLKEEIMQAISS